MIRRVAGLCVALLLLVGGERAAAQAAGRTSVGPMLATVTFQSALADPAPVRDLASLNAELRRATRPTHWLTGGLIGAAVLGAGAVALTAGLCNEDSGTDNCTWPIIGGGLVGAGVGFALGALIGGQIPKGEPAPAAP